MSNGNNNNDGTYGGLFPSVGGALTPTAAVAKPSLSPSDITGPIIEEIAPGVSPNIVQMISKGKECLDPFITQQTFQDTSCKDYLLTEFGNYDSDPEFEPQFLKNKLELNPTIADKVRAKTGNFWTNHTITQSGIKKDAFSYFRKAFSDQVPVSIIFNPLDQPPDRSEEGLFHSTEEYIAFKADQLTFSEWVVPAANEEGNSLLINQQFLPQKYNVFLEGGEFSEITYEPMIDLESEFTDHTCLINAFYKLKEVNISASYMPTCYAEIKDQYNAYIEPYEKFISKDEVGEATLPNLYALYLMKQDGANEDFRNLITLNQDPKVAGTLGGKPRGEYFTKYAERRSQMTEASLQNIKDKYKNVIIPYGDIKNNILYNENANLFPMSVNINFKTDSRTEFAEVLKESQLSTVFLKYIVDLLEAPNDTLGILDVFEYGVEHAKRNVILKFDLTAFIGLIQSGEFFERFESNNAVFLGMLKDEPDINNLSDYSMILSLLSSIFSAKISEIVNKHFRTFCEVMAGKPAYSETVMYKICKYRGDEPIQRIFLPNSNEVDIHNYIDTQVKYGEVYTYKIFGYEMVIGNKYQYTDLQHEPQFQDIALAKVKQTPSVQLLETELFTRVLAVIDHPPVAPEINIVPFKGVNNKIRHLLNRSTGRIETHPIIIEEHEENFWTNYKILKDIAPDEPVVYKSDDIPKYFEVYRMLEKPEKYQDFSGHKIAKIRTDIDLETIQKAASATYDDAIRPNQKYYYMFRSLDVHNKVSLPTEVFEVEIIYDKGVVYPQIKAIELKKANTNIPNKVFKRFLKIKPTTSQLFFDEEKLSELDSAKDASNVKLGLVGESVWDKKFKLRLTSRQTGRKIDINFQFGHNHKPE